MRRWIVHLALAVLVDSIRRHRFLWPLAVSLVRGATLNDLLGQVATMTSTTFDDLLAAGSFRLALREALDAYDGPANEGVALLDTFFGRVEAALEDEPHE